MVGTIFYCIFASGEKQMWAAGYTTMEEVDDVEDDDE